MGCTQQDDIGRTGHTVVLGLLLYVKHDDVGQLSQVGLDNLHVRIVGDVDKGGRRRDNPALFLQVGQVAQSLHGLHGYDDIGSALGDEVAGYGV